MDFIDKILLSIVVYILGTLLAIKFTVVENKKDRTEYYKKEDYSKLIALNEQLEDKKKKIFSYKYEMLYLNFAINDNKGYSTIRSTVTPLMMKLHNYQDIIIMMDMVKLI